MNIKNLSNKRFNKIYVEIGNTCNLQCSFCPEVLRHPKQLNISQLDHILAQIKDLTERTCFHVMGEPLSHAQFSQCIALAEKSGTPLEITTNGTLLNDENSVALLNPIVHQVNFSLQSFLDNYPQANITSYLNHIFQFIRKARELRKDLYINLRLWNLTEHELNDEKNKIILEKIETEFSVKINSRVDPKLIKSKRLIDRIYLHYDTRFQWPNLAQKQIRTQGTCYGTRNQIAILTEGTVVPCCLDKEGKISLGNIFEQSLHEILESQKFNAIKSGFEQNKLVEELCQKCEFAQRFPLN